MRHIHLMQTAVSVFAAADFPMEEAPAARPARRVDGFQRWNSMVGLAQAGSAGDWTAAAPFEPGLTEEESTQARVAIRSSMDIIRARQQARAMAMELGFAGSDVTLVAAAISEVARNIVDYAQRGEIVLEPIENNGRRGILIIARDQGPGIADVAKAMQYGYSSRQGLGVGLPGVRLLMDEFNIISKVGRGTTITMKKWLS
jgi:serine/threonine-protein kinase RsbT